MNLAVRNAIFAVVMVAGASASLAGALPPDVPSYHWAAPAVGETLRNGVMKLPDGRAFHGDARATRADAAIAVAKLAQMLEAGTWRAAKSVAVRDPDGLAKLGTAWRSQPVTRYTLAVTLARIGDYVTNGVERAAANSTDVAKSIVIPEAPPVPASAGGPVRQALLYLASKRMIWKDSPFASNLSQPITGGELSNALAEMTLGLNDRVTDLGHDETGSTPDKSFTSKNKKR